MASVILHEHLAAAQDMLLQGRVRDALALAESLQAEGRMDADTANLYFSHARSWHISGFAPEQKRLCGIVLAVLPEHHEALHLLGFHAQSKGEYARATLYYEKAVALNPLYAFSKLALSQMRMLQTRFREGRELYESRFDAVTEASGPDWRGLPYPRWCGEPLAGKKLYLWAEQGLGDICMFAAFLPCLLAQSPARIALGMFPKLIALFQRSFPAIAVETIDDAANHALAPTMLTAYPQIEALARQTQVPFSLEPLRASYDYARLHGLFDYAAPMGDMLVHCLPGFIPAVNQHSYLSADPARLEEVRRKLHGLGKGRRIGISWLTTNRREAQRSLPLEEWLPLLRLPGCHFVSLQHQVAADDIRRFCAANGCSIFIDESTDLVQDAEGLAALIAAMDEVVTIDNSIVHLAGALGVKTTLLLPRGHNYRWPEESNGGTLWYESVQILRQGENPRRQALIEQAAQRLAAGGR